MVGIGIVKIISRENEIKILQYFNDQLAIENNRYFNMLGEERDRYDELKGRFDEYLGLQRHVETSTEGINSIGGFQSPSKKGKMLSLASARKFMDEEKED